MSFGSGYGSPWLLYLGLLFLGTLAAGSLLRIQVLQIGDQGPCMRVSEGDVISLEFTHSMYGVPVEERFRVEGRHLALFHVKTSDAALEYYGIEGRDEGNVRRELDQFTIPGDSVGGQTLRVKDRLMVLRELPGGRKSVTIRLAREPILLHVVHCLWR